MNDLNDLNPDMLLDEFNDKSDFDDLGAPTTAVASTAVSAASTNSIANSGPPRTTTADLNNSSNNPGKLFDIHVS